MATKTRRDLIDQAARNLGVLPPGVTLSDEEATSIGAYVDPLMNELEQTDIAFVDADEIEEGLFLSLAVLLADACKYEYGGGEFAVEEARKKLRKIGRSRPTYETVKTLYY